MVSGFNRSISLPMNPKLKVQATYHARSVSLPPQSHSLISNLEKQILAIQLWAARSDGSIAWLEAGLIQIELLHAALNDFLNLSATKDALQRGNVSTEYLLDSLLNLVDLFGSLLSSIAMLKQQIFEVQSAFRRCDSNGLASSLKSQRKTEKELKRFAFSLRALTKSAPLECASNAAETEIFSILKDAICATTAASLLILNRVVAVSTIAYDAATSSVSSRVTLFTKKFSKEERETVALEKLAESEECVEIVERGSEKVFRGLINSRVSLLNIQSDLF